MKYSLYLALILSFTTLWCSGQNNSDWDKKLTKADQLFTDYNNSKASIAALIINNDSVQFIKKYGNNTENYDQVYDLGKISKYFTAIGILKLVEENKIKLTDKLSLFFPELPGYADSITVENLLIHKSQLPFLSKDIDFRNQNEIDNFLANVNLNKHFEGKTIFNDLDYYLLFRIIGSKYKKGYVKFITKEILKPLKIKNVIIIDHNFKSFSNLPKAYVTRDSMLQEFNKPSYNKILPGASGIYMSINDLSKFIINLNQGKIISKETFRNVYSSEYFDDKENGTRSFYGLNGIKETVYNTDYFYDGGFTDFGSQSALRIPVVNVNVILLTNQPGIFG